MISKIINTDDTDKKPVWAGFGGVHNEEGGSDDNPPTKLGLGSGVIVYFFYLLAFTHMSLG